MGTCKKAYTRYNMVKVVILPSKPLSSFVGANKYPDLYQLIPKDIDKLFSNYIAQEKIDVVHLFGPETSFPFQIACNKHQIPFIMSYNSETVDFMHKATKLPYWFCLCVNKIATDVMGVYN